MARQAATKQAQQLHKSLYQLQASGSAMWRDMPVMDEPSLF
jgi:hypothetical protein